MSAGSATCHGAVCDTRQVDIQNCDDVVPLSRDEVENDGEVIMSVPKKRRQVLGDERTEDVAKLGGDVASGVDHASQLQNRATDSPICARAAGAADLQPRDRGLHRSTTRRARTATVGAVGPDRCEP
jgi:hypothetical protein